MLPGMNPKQMQKVMKQMGIKQVDIEATEVIIKTKDKELVFTNPDVAKVNAMGQETYQIIGTPEERSLQSYTKDDIKTVAEQANVSEEEAETALEETNGDLAEAILKLTQTSE